MTINEKDPATWPPCPRCGAPWVNVPCANADWQRFHVSPCTVDEIPEPTAQADKIDDAIDGYIRRRLQGEKAAQSGAPPLAPEGIDAAVIRNVGRALHTAQCNYDIRTCGGDYLVHQVLAVTTALAAAGWTVAPPQADAKANLARASHSLAPEGTSDRKALADLIHDDQREQCDLDPEGFYDCEQLADRILAAGFRRAPEGQSPPHEIGYALTCAERERDNLRESWIAARHVVFAAREVCSAWPATLDFGKPGTSIGSLRAVLTAYDQRNHDDPAPGGSGGSGEAG